MNPNLGHGRHHNILLHPHTNYSFRKGGASSIASKVGLAILKIMGRWRSDAYQYTPFRAVIGRFVRFGRLKRVCTMCPYRTKS